MGLNLTFDNFSEYGFGDKTHWAPIHVSQRLAYREPVEIFLFAFILGIYFLAPDWVIPNLLKKIEEFDVSKILDELECGLMC